jgi:hypothetical protein
MTTHRALAALAALIVLASTPAFAGDDWETVATGAITVKARNKQGTAIREIWAEGEISAPVRDIQSTILDSESYPKFMPYVKECRFIGKPDADGSKYVYTKLDLPMVSARDYVVKVNTPQQVAADGSGVFENKWVSVWDKIPTRSSVVRLKTNEGSWLVTPKDNGSKSHVIYKFTVDPGGMIPSFAANMGNKSGISDTFKAVEKEALRRKAEREKAQAAKP